MNPRNLKPESHYETLTTVKVSDLPIGAYFYYAPESGVDQELRRKVDSSQGGSIVIRDSDGYMTNTGTCTLPAIPAERGQSYEAARAKATTIRVPAPTPGLRFCSTWDGTEYTVVELDTNADPQKGAVYALHHGNKVCKYTSNWERCVRRRTIQIL